MDAHGFYHRVHTDNFERIVKKGVKNEEWAKASMIGKRLNEEGSGCMGVEKQRSGRECGLCQ